MAATNSVSLAEYLAHFQGEKPAFEFLDGQKPLGTPDHSVIQYRLLRLLDEQGLKVYPEVSLRMSSEKVLIPDVVANETQ